MTREIKIKGKVYDIEHDKWDIWLMSRDESPSFVIDHGFTALLTDAEYDCRTYEGRDADGEEIIDWDKDQANEIAEERMEAYIEENFDKAKEI